MDNCGKKTIVIVGGGITSCVLALFLCNKHKIKIYESRSYLGGIMNDYTYKDKLYFRGCQYLNIDNFWFKKFYKIFHKHLRIFTHTYSSYTQFGKNLVTSNNVAVPIFKKFNQGDLKNKINSKNSALDRFSYYPKSVASFMIKYLKKFQLDPKKIYFTGMTGLQLSRAAYLDGNEELKNVKNKNKIYDEIFAISREQFKNKNLMACLPKNSFNFFFKIFYDYLTKKGVEININSPVYPEWIKKKELILLDKGNNTIESNYVIWTGNPSQLVYKYNKKKLESLKVFMTQINIDAISKNNDHYIQVFSGKTQITKIYVYNLNSKTKISIEVAGKIKDVKNVILEAKKIFKEFKFKVKLNIESINLKLDVRYNVISLSDKKILENFNKSTVKTNLITCDWSLYGRDQKIDSFYRSLRLKKIN